MKYLILLLFVAQASASTITYQIVPSNQLTYIHNYRPSIDSAVEWENSSNTLLTYDTVTTQLSVSGTLINPNSPHSLDYFPFWMSQELTLDYIRTGDFVEDSSSNLEMKDYQGNLITTHTIDSWLIHADDFSWISLYIYAYGAKDGDNIETGPSFYGQEISMHNPEPASLLLSCLGLPFFSLRKKKAN